jgi:hypothetical protein
MSCWYIFVDLPEVRDSVECAPQTPHALTNVQVIRLILHHVYAVEISRML